MLWEIFRLVKCYYDPVTETESGRFCTASNAVSCVFCTASNAVSCVFCTASNAVSCVFCTCLLYTSDAADDMQCVDLGGRRIIKK